MAKLPQAANSVAVAVQCLTQVQRRVLYMLTGPGKLLMGGVRDFEYLRPQNHQIFVHKFGYLITLAILCPKFWIFEGRFLLS
jgi:hypothetical protein